LLGNVGRSGNRSDDLNRYKPIDGANERGWQRQRLDAIWHNIAKRDIAKRDIAKRDIAKQLAIKPNRSLVER